MNSSAGSVATLRMSPAGWSRKWKRTCSSSTSSRRELLMADRTGPAALLPELWRPLTGLPRVSAGPAR